MRWLVVVFMLLCPASIFAQQVDSRVDVYGTKDDAAALEVLRQYADYVPHGSVPQVEFSIRAWRPHGITFVIPPAHLDKLLWHKSASMPEVKVSIPEFTDYNSIRINIGRSRGASITITNGSAYNYMPWLNSPIGYRDARTLSFPTPR